MRNIPTDFLRTFINVIDLRSYTRAGEQLGRTQPAVSLQMKKLEDLVGVQLFAKDGGVVATEAGEMVATYGRQMLALNDELMLRVSSRDSRGKLRLGIPNDYADHFLPTLMSGIAQSSGDFTIEVVCDISHKLLEGLRNGFHDIVVAMTTDGPAEGAFMTWREPLVWVGGQDGNLIEDAEGRLRIVCYPEGCLYRKGMLNALQRDGRKFDVVYQSPSLSGIEAAVVSGFGNTVLARRIVPPRLTVVERDHLLPRPSDVVVGIYLNNGKGSSPVAESFAARIADAFVKSETAAFAPEDAH